jgi:tetratricopeptide (TPR) repeat protein
VAKINVVKLKNDAAKATNQQNYSKAIDLLKQIVQENPRDANTLNQIGFLYEKLNNVKAANEQYAKVADFYARDGFYLKAIACWKKVLKNDPALTDAHLNLGDLYAKQGLAAEAKSSLGLAYQECVNRNRLREAGDVLKRMAELDPSDMKVRVRLADLYARDGRQDQAAGEYLALADELVKKGHRQEALQLLEKGLKIGKRSPKLLTEVARVHLVQKDFASALPFLEEARQGAPDDRDVALRMAEAYLGEERFDDARGVLEELLQKDENDHDAKTLLGRVYLGTGQPDEAYAQLLPGVDRLVGRREFDLAVSLLQPITQAEPPHIPALGKLVELYRQSRNEAMVVQTYSQMVEAYLAREEMEQAASVLELLVQLEPHNEQHRGKLEWIRNQGVVPAPADSVPGGGSDPGLAAPDTQPPGAAPSAAAAAEGEIPLSGPLTPEDQEFIDEHLSEGRVFRKYGLTDKARDQFEAALSRFPDNIDARRELVDLHNDRGEADTAAQHLRAIAQILRLKGDEEGAAEAEAAAAAATPSDEAAPAEAEEAATAAAPEAGPALEPESAAEPAPTGEEMTLEPEEAPGAEAAPAVEDEVEISVEVEGPAEADDAPELELVEVAEEEPEKPLFEDGDLAAESGEIQGDFIDMEEPAAPPAGTPAPEEDSGTFDLGEPDEVATPPAAEPGGLVPQAAPAAEGPASDVPEDLQRVLSDVEQYVSLGFVEDAKEALAELGGRYMDHPALLGKLSELGLEAPSGPVTPAPEPAPVEAPPAEAEAPPLEDLTASPEAAPEAAPLEELAPPVEAPTAPEEAVPSANEPLQLGALEFTPAPAVAAPEPPTAPDAPPGGGGEGFDLSDELGDLFGAQPAVAQAEKAEEGTDLGDEALTGLFREFQKGVDKQLGKEDYETRYNLGIAYKEMGLVDEAVAEFQLAAKDEGRLLECASMLGICFIEKGMPKLAVKWFEKGLQAQGRTEAEYLGLQYDLASALEASGENARALEIFTEIYGQDAGFRDVADKVRQLGGQ